MRGAFALANLGTDHKVLYGAIPVSPELWVFMQLAGVHCTPRCLVLLILHYRKANFMVFPQSLGTLQTAVHVFPAQLPFL